MKKKLALLLSAIMVVGMIPMTAFAVTTNEINKIVTGKADDSISGSILTIKEKSLAEEETATFKLTLTNAEWDLSGVTVGGGPANYPDAEITTVGTSAGAKVKAEQLNATQIIVAVDSTGTKIGLLRLPLNVKLKGEGNAEVTIDPMNSVVSSGTYKFGNVVAGATVTTIEKKNDVQEKGSEIKSIVITEATAGSLKGTSDVDAGEFKLKLTNGFEFLSSTVTELPTTRATAVAPSAVGIAVSAYPSTDFSGGFKVYASEDGQELYIFSVAMSGDNTFATTEPATISISKLTVGFDEDDVKIGDVAEVTISGYGMTKTTLEAATAVSYGVSIAAENKTLPVFVAGRTDDTETLKVTFKETVSNSWLNNRKTEITFPEGIKVVDKNISSGVKGFGSESDFVLSVSEKSDHSVVAIKTANNPTGKVEAKFTFELAIAPDFTGDIVATFGGAGLEEDVEVVLGTVVAPITVEAETNEVSIDYRNVAIGDIIIKETEAGNLEKGKTLFLELEELKFDGTPTVEVLEGDLKIDTVKVTNKGRLEIKIKTASSKTPAVLKVTDNELYLDRTIPAGSYELSVVQGGTNTTDAMFQTYDADGKNLGFDVDEVVVLKDFIEVVTAGRDQDDSTFTTKISVTIGADKLVAGKTEIALDVPAYISEGYTMLPVRAVTEALSGKAIVRWDDSTKTVTITFGSRVVSMTVGSKVMNINGVAVQMSKACEITDSRAFIPLRDLGYALGLNDSKINWDDATKTATLN